MLDIVGLIFIDDDPCRADVGRYGAFMIASIAASVCRLAGIRAPSPAEGRPATTKLGPERLTILVGAVVNL